MLDCKSSKPMCCEISRPSISDNRDVWMTLLISVYANDIELRQLSLTPSSTLEILNLASSASFERSQHRKIELEKLAAVADNFASSTQLFRSSNQTAASFHV